MVARNSGGGLAHYRGPSCRLAVLLLLLPLPLLFAFCLFSLCLCCCLFALRAVRCLHLNLNEWKRNWHEFASTPLCLPSPHPSPASPLVAQLGSPPPPPPQAPTSAPTSWHIFNFRFYTDTDTHQHTDTSHTWTKAQERADAVWGAAGGGWRMVMGDRVGEGPLETRGGNVRLVFGSKTRHCCSLSLSLSLSHSASGWGIFRGGLWGGGGWCVRPFVASHVPLHLYFYFILL